MYLKLDVSLLADGYMRAHIGIVLVLLQKRIATEQDGAKPLENGRVVDDLVLNELLGDRE